MKFYQPRVKWLAAMAAVIALSATGCAGGTSPAGSTTSTTAAVDFESIKKDDALAAKLPANIVSEGKVKVASDISFPPMTFYSEANEPTGFDHDLATAMGRVLGVDFQFENLSFDGILGGLSSGRFDLALSGIPDTKEREEVVDFVNYVKSGLTTLTLKGDPHKLTGNNDLCGHNVGAQRGTSGEFGANAMNKRCLAAGKAGVNITTFPHQPDAIQALQSGRVEAVTAQSVSLLYIVSTTGEAFELVNGKLTGVSMGIAVPKKNTQLRDALQAALIEVQESGVYDQILAKWGLSEDGLPGAPINGATS